MSLPAIAICDACFGPANWCFDRAGDVWQLCVNESCISRTQLDLFPEEPIWDEGVARRTRRHESDDSHQTQNQVPEGDLPF